MIDQDQEDQVEYHAWNDPEQILLHLQRQTTILIFQIIKKTKQKVAYHPFSVQVPHVPPMTKSIHSFTFHICSI